MSKDDVRNPDDSTEQVGFIGAEEQALQQAGFTPEQIAAVQARIVASDSGSNTATVVPPALEGLTSQQWDVLGAITTTHATDTIASPPFDDSARLGPDIVETSPGSTIVFDEDPPPPPPQKPDLMPDQVDPLPLSPVEEPPPKPDLMPEGVGPLSVGEGPHPIKGEPPGPPQPVPIKGHPSLIDPNEPPPIQIEPELPEPGPSPDLIIPSYDDSVVTPHNPVLDSVYGQVQKDPINVVHEVPDDFGKVQPLDPSSAYEEVYHEGAILDSVYGQVQGATPPKVEPSQYPPDLGSAYADVTLNPDLSAAYEEVLLNPQPLPPEPPPDLFADRFDPSEYVSLNPQPLPPEPPPDLSAAYEEVALNPQPLPPEPAAFAPGPALDPSLFDPTAPGETIDPALLDPSAYGPSLDPALLEQGIMEPSGVADPYLTAYPTDPGLTEPYTADQDVQNQDFEGF